MHNCINCAHAQRFDREFPLAEPIPAFYFTCSSGQVLEGPYGPYQGHHVMWWWPTTDTCEVDGGQNIPHEGCEAFKSV
jgi:hypothetical protein